MTVNSELIIWAENERAKLCGVFKVPCMQKFRQIHLVTLNCSLLLRKFRYLSVNISKNIVYGNFFHVDLNLDKTL